MRPLELTVEGFRSYRERVTFDWRGRRLVGDRRSDRLGEVLDPRRDVVRAVRQDAAGGGRHEVADPPAGRPVARRAPVPGGRAGVARACDRSGARARPGISSNSWPTTTPDAEVLEVVTLEGAMNERIEQLARHGLQDVLSLGAAGAEPVRRVPEGDARAARRGAEGRLRVRAARRRARAWRRCTSSGSTWSSTSLGKERERIVEAREQLDEARAAADDRRERLHALDDGRPRDRAAGEGARCRGGRCRLGDRPHRRTLDRDRAARFRMKPTSSARPRPRVTPARGSPRRRASRRRGGRGSARPARPSSPASRSRHGDREQFRSFATPGADTRATRRGGRVGARSSGGACAAPSSRRRATSRGDEASRPPRPPPRRSRRADEALAARVAGVEAARAALMAATHAEMAHELRGTPRGGRAVPGLPRRRSHHGAEGRRRAQGQGGREARSPRRRRPRRRRATERDRCAGRRGIGRGPRSATRAPPSGARRPTLSRRRGRGGRRHRGRLAATKDQLVGWLGEDGDPRSLFEAREAELTAAEQAVESRARRGRGGASGSRRGRAARRGRGRRDRHAREPAVGRVGPPRGGPRRPRGAGRARVGVRRRSARIVVTRHERATAERDVATRAR